MLDRVRIIVLNKVKRNLRNRLLLLICIILPVVFYMLAGEIFTKSSISDNIPVAVIDEDKSDMSRSIVGNLKKNKTLKVYEINRKDMRSRLSSGSVQGIYILKSGMEEKIISGEYDGLLEVYYLPDNFVAQGITDIIAGELLEYVCSISASEEGREVLEGYGEKIDLLPEILVAADKIKEENITRLPVNIKMETPDNQRIEISNFDGRTIPRKFGLGMVIIFNTLFLFSGCVEILREKCSGTTKRIYATGVSALEFVISDILGLMLAGMAVGIIQFILISRSIGLGNLYKSGTVIIIYAVYLFVAANILLIFAGIFKNPVSFQSFIPVVIFFAGLLGGCLWSTELMPGGIIYISRLLPTYWVHDALTKVVIYGLPAVKALKNILILLVTGVISMGANIYIRQSSFL